jgi:hypothetical protein
MFDEILISTSSTHESCDHQIKDVDLKEILCKLNNGCFVDRVLPAKDLKREIRRIFEENKSPNLLEPNCHDITGELEKRSSNLERVYGFLAISKTKIRLSSPYLVVNERSIKFIDRLLENKKEFEANQGRKQHCVMEVVQEYNYVITKLEHHSVVLDNQGNYIECIYERYPLASGENEVGYVFFPHESGKWGYNLKVHSPII